MEMEKGLAAEKLVSLGSALSGLSTTNDSYP